MCDFDMSISASEHQRCHFKIIAGICIHTELQECSDNSLTCQFALNILGELLYLLFYMSRSNRKDACQFIADMQEFNKIYTGPQTSRDL